MGALFELIRSSPQKFEWWPISCLDSMIVSQFLAVFIIIPAHPGKLHLFVCLTSFYDSIRYLQYSPSFIKYLPVTSGLFVITQHGLLVSCTY